MASVVGPNIEIPSLIHAFDAGSTRSFNLFPTVVEVLVIAGGGGGGVGSNAGGGGGAGGVIYNPTFSISGATSFTVTVGAGGAGKAGRGSGANGANSVFSSLTAVGGGRGGGHPNGGGSVSPNTGGSGGGGSYSAAGAAGTSGQGFAGGTGAVSGSKPTPNDGGGAGGGAGAVGQDAQGSGGPGGDGGAGATYSISGSPVVYAGGGGGATNDSASMSPGGTGGGGRGGSATDPNKSGTAGLVNSGSGGGAGNGGGGNSGAGGSGIIIIRYAGNPLATGGTITSANGFTIHTFTSSGTFASAGYAYDLVGTDNGTLNNGVTFNSVNGGCWEFDGLNDYIDVTGASETQTSTGTFEAWIYPVTGGQGDQIFCGIGGGTTVGASRTIRIVSNQWAFVGYGGGTEDWSGIQAVTYNAWAHILFTWSGTSLTYYVNGTKYTATRSGLVTPNSSIIRLGVSPWSTTDREFVGKIALSRFYNVVLTEAEALQNFNAQRNRFGI